MAEKIVLRGGRESLTQDVLRRYLRYDAQSGLFFWTSKPSRSTKIGSRAGTLDRHGYVLICIGRVRFLAHRLAWFMERGAWPENDIDHINGVPSDNRLCNLRPATRGENLQNQRRAHSHNQSRLMGAFRVGGASTFMARIVVDGKKIRLGNFATAEEAHAAYMTAKARLHPYATPIA